MTRNYRIVALLALALALAVPGLAPSAVAQTAAKKAVAIDTEQLYLQAFGEDRKTGPLDAKTVAAARAWVDGLDAILLVDQEILGSGRGAAEALYQKNKGKNKSVRNFTEHEIVPYLFKSSDMFRDIFALSIADTFTADEVKKLGTRMTPQDPLAAKITEAGKKFDRVASFLAGALTAQMIQKSNFSSYGLDLTTPVDAKQ